MSETGNVDPKMREILLSQLSGILEQESQSKGGIFTPQSAARVGAFLRQCETCHGHGMAEEIRSDIDLLMIPVLGG